MKLKSILRNKMHISRKLLSQLKMTEHGITVNGQRLFMNSIVTTGDCVEVRMIEETSPDILPQKIPLSILFEDDDLLVLNKPAGLIVHPTIGHYINTLANGVMYHWQTEGKKYRFRPVHRLDQYTSGVVVIAKNPFVQQRIAEQMNNGTIERMYVALVHGCPTELSGTVNAPIGRSDEDPHVRVVRADGFASITHYKVLKSNDTASYVQCKLETGRTHQIRVHMKYIGHPVIGDPLYGGTPIHGANHRQLLHAKQLQMTHPTTDQRMKFEAPLPEDFSNVLSQLFESRDDMLY